MEELAGIRSTLLYSTDLSNIGRRLGLQEDAAAATGSRALDWAQHGARSTQLRTLAEQVAALQRVGRGQTAPGRADRRAEAVEQEAAEEEEIVVVDDVEEEQVAEEQPDGKIDRMLLELSRLSPRAIGSAECTADSTLNRSPSGRVRSQVDTLAHRQQTAARRAQQLQGASAGLDELWSEADSVLGFASRHSFTLDPSATDSWAARHAQAAREKDELRRQREQLEARLARPPSAPGPLRIGNSVPAAAGDLCTDEHADGGCAGKEDALPAQPELAPQQEKLKPEPEPEPESQPQPAEPELETVPAVPVAAGRSFASAGRGARRRAKHLSPTTLEGSAAQPRPTTVQPLLDSAAQPRPAAAVQSVLAQAVAAIRQPAQPTPAVSTGPRGKRKPRALQDRHAARASAPQLKSATHIGAVGATNSSKNAGGLHVNVPVHAAAAGKKAAASRPRPKPWPLAERSGNQLPVAVVGLVD